ncbi:MAG: hypothetical protein IPP32_13890 [Bacteroidetes bacterium]|nr:hypothetical protein [Bacteroidota bacterium]
MKKNKLLLVILFLIVAPAIAQDSNTDEPEQTQVATAKKKKFLVGLYIGSYFANKHSAYNYDGYGYDLGGQRNSFETSFMNTKINFQYSGAYGQPDYIAQELGVQPGDWNFDVSDMPVNMRYNVAFLVGLNGRYAVSDNGAIVFHANASKLSVSGNFTITTRPNSNGNQLQKTVQTFAIVGGEQRLLLQVGYQHLAGDAAEKINFLVEGGLNVTMAKFDKNQIQINNLQIDLTSYYDINNPNSNATARRPGGVGFGAFAGAGFNFNVNPKTKIQLVYNPSYEQIKVEQNAPLKLQHAIGLRLYYGL